MILKAAWRSLGAMRVSMVCDRQPFTNRRTVILAV